VIQHRRILDTSRLVSFWRGKLRKNHWPDVDRARSWAAELIRLEATAAIVTPVRIEFLCGASSSDQLRIYEAFLELFDVIDNGQIGPSDWEAATRLARRIPRSGKPRQLGDCLIRAIASRLRYDVMTNEVDFPR
jgi:predicted nucleic acid-binding protein